MTLLSHVIIKPGLGVDHGQASGAADDWLVVAVVRLVLWLRFFFKSASGTSHEIECETNERLKTAVCVRRPCSQNRQWLVNAIVTPEKEILSSAGLDAVVMTWSLKIGINLFLPMAVLGCVLRE